MNPNVLHRWLSEHERFGYHDIAGFYDEGNHELDQLGNVNSNWLSILPKPQTVPTVQPKRVIRLNSARQEDKLHNNSSETINITVKSDSLSLDLQWTNTDHTGPAKFIKEIMASS